MIGYHPTNGERGEICVDWDGNFVGFIVRLDTRRWSAFTRKFEPIEGEFGSRADAATACRHNLPPGERKIPIARILAAKPEKG